MTVTKNAKGLWDVQFYYRDYTNKTIKKHKRNFATKREAIEYAEQFKVQKAKDISMTFSSFVELYLADMETRLRYNTMRSKRYIIELKLLPYFGKKKLSEITASDIRLWQQEMLKKGYKPTYLKTINNQLSAMFNYAVRYYDLPKNPCAIAGTMGKSNADEMKYYTLEEFEQFVECLKDKPMSYYAMQMLYWTGIRCGELLAITIGDINLDEKTLVINKSLQRIDGKDIISDPKTQKSKRVIALPQHLVNMLGEYMSMLYGKMKKDRLFEITKSYLEHEMARGSELSGVKRIRLHDLRHSHASLLISKLGAQPLQVAQRLGHERIQTTLGTYSHMYPNQARELANQIDALIKEKKEGD